MRLLRLEGRRRWTECGSRDLFPRIRQIVSRTPVGAQAGNCPREIANAAPERMRHPGIPASAEPAADGRKRLRDRPCRRRSSATDSQRRRPTCVQARRRRSRSSRCSPARRCRRRTSRRQGCAPSWRICRRGMRGFRCRRGTRSCRRRVRTRCRGRSGSPRRIAGRLGR